MNTCSPACRRAPRWSGVGGSGGAKGCLPPSLALLSCCPTDLSRHRAALPHAALHHGHRAQLARSVGWRGRDRRAAAASGSLAQRGCPGAFACAPRPRLCMLGIRLLISLVLRNEPPKLTFEDGHSRYKGSDPQLPSHWHTRHAGLSCVPTRAFRRCTVLHLNRRPRLRRRRPLLTRRARWAASPTRCAPARRGTAVTRWGERALLQAAAALRRASEHAPTTPLSSWLTVVPRCSTSPPGISRSRPVWRVSTCGGATSEGGGGAWFSVRRADAMPSLPVS